MIREYKGKKVMLNRSIASCSKCVMSRYATQCMDKVNLIEPELPAYTSNIMCLALGGVWVYGEGLSKNTQVI